jgi:hypothetical protein
VSHAVTVHQTSTVAHLPLILEVLRKLAVAANPRHSRCPVASRVTGEEKTRGVLPIAVIILGDLPRETLSRHVIGKDHTRALARADNRPDAVQALGRHHDAQGARLGRDAHQVPTEERSHRGRSQEGIEGMLWLFLQPIVAVLHDEAVLGVELQLPAPFNLVEI